MLTLSYGYKKPQTNDKGSVVFPAMEDNIDRLNDHTHDGIDSAPLSPNSIAATSASILAANWTLVSGGLYSQVVTMPSGLTFDNTIKEFRLSDGSIVYPTFTKVTNTTYTIYLNDNTQTLTVFYK